MPVCVWVVCVPYFIVLFWLHYFFVWSCAIFRTKDSLVTAHTLFLFLLAHFTGLALFAFVLSCLFIVLVFIFAMFVVLLNAVACICFRNILSPLFEFIFSFGTIPELESLRCYIFGSRSLAYWTLGFHVVWSTSCCCFFHSLFLLPLILCYNSLVCSICRVISYIDFRRSTCSNLKTFA